MKQSQSFKNSMCNIKVFFFFFWTIWESCPVFSPEQVSVYFLKTRACSSTSLLHNCCSRQDQEMDAFSPVDSLDPMHVSPAVPIMSFTAKGLDPESPHRFLLSVTVLLLHLGPWSIWSSFLCMVWDLGSSFILLHLDNRLCQHHVLKTLPFWMALTLLSNQ